MKLVLTFSTEVGKNEFFDIRNELDKFVKENFNLLLEGAVRLGCNIDADYYAPARVQINNTRLHEREHLKYAAGHKYSELVAPTQEQLTQTCVDLQKLIDAANGEILALFSLSIVHNR